MYTIKRTDTFVKHLKKYKKNQQVLTELGKKLQRLQTEPDKVGGRLSGKLHGLKSTRLAKNIRLIFKIDDKTVWLMAIDHRGTAYE